jgi:hypothetical protein
LRSQIIKIRYKKSPSVLTERLLAVWKSTRHGMGELAISNHKIRYKKSPSLLTERLLAVWRSTHHGMGELAISNHKN